MTAQLSSVAPLEKDDESRSEAKSEDLFRRATFNWALATQRLVQSSKNLGPHTRVPHTALVDIESAMRMLDGMFVPTAVKTPAGYERDEVLTVKEIKDAVLGAVKRIRGKQQPPRDFVPELVVNEQEEDNKPISCVVVSLESADPGEDFYEEDEPVEKVIAAFNAGEKHLTRPPAPTSQIARGRDLAAPVYPKGNLMTWAYVTCPVCQAKPNQRCLKEDGAYVEKPHPARKRNAEKGKLDGDN